MAKKGVRNFPRKTSKQPPSWRVVINVLGNGNGFKGFSHIIPFKAFNGGEAQGKALPKIQHFLEVSLWDVHGSPKVDLLLEKIPINGKSNGGVPSYISRKNRSYFQGIMRVKRPSQLFEVANA
ncbi:MAG: hypothetical protein WC678_00685 [Parcubacteria group bacterium]|jgi:hypothetical protein